MSYSEQQHYLIVKVKELRDELQRVPLISDFNKKFPNLSITTLFGSYDNFLRAAGIIEAEPEPNLKPRLPKIGVLDIETKPIKLWSWGMYDQNHSTDMIIEDWSVLSWVWKWIGNDEIFYQDQSKNTDYTKDELIVCGVWQLLNECDVVITQNGVKFDVPKLNGKFEEYGLGPPSPYRHIDTFKISKKLGLTSKKLAFMTDKFNNVYKKMDHAKYPGISLWLQCLEGNQDAWASMKEYNIYDVLSTEELYLEHLIKWDSTINYGVYTGVKFCCPNCGSTELKEGQHNYTKTGAFQNYQCVKCKSWSNSKVNELPKDLKKGLLK